MMASALDHIGPPRIAAGKVKNLDFARGAEITPLQS
jgi:hypothetical protein